MLRLILWLWKTQQNGKGPHRYLGLTAIELFVFSLAALLIASGIYLFT